MTAVQETPAVEGLVPDDAAVNEALPKEGPKPQDALGLAQESLNRPAPSAPVPPAARGNRGDANTAGNSDTPRGASLANLLRGTAPLSESGSQQAPAAGETAFKAQIRPKITAEDQTSAASDANAGKTTQQGPHATPANLGSRNLSAAARVRENEPITESPLSQARTLPAKTADTYVPNLPGAAQPSSVSPAPRPSAPAAPLPVEFHTAEFEPLSTKPAGDVTIQLRSEEHGTANIRFREQAGQVQVTVRAADPQLVNSLRNGLDHLKSGLDSQGFQTTVFSSSPAAALRKGDAEGSSDTYHRAHEEPSSHEQGPRDHSGRGNKQAEEWMDEIE
jgi:hypothetical protein